MPWYRRYVVCGRVRTECFRRSGHEKKRPGCSRVYYEWKKAEDGKKIPHHLYSEKNELPRGPNGLRSRGFGGSRADRYPVIRQRAWNSGWSA